MRGAMSTAGGYTRLLLDVLRTVGVDGTLLSSWGERDGLELAAEEPRADLIHLHWPEALLSFDERRMAREETLAEIRRLLDRLCAHTPLVLTCHNLQPHESFNPPFEHKLYTHIIEHASVLLHHSEYGMRAVKDRYTQARQRRN